MLTINKIIKIRHLHTYGNVNELAKLVSKHPSKNNNGPVYRKVLCCVTIHHPT